MISILIGTETEIYTVVEADPDDEWDNGVTEGYVSNVWACVSDKEPRNWSESIVVDMPGVEAGDTLYIAVADYSDGNTFGRYGGYSQVLDAFTDQETAEGLAKAADEATEVDWRKEYGWDFEFNGKQYHRSWAGYFEILNSVDVWKVTVLDSAVDPYRVSSYGQGHKLS